MWGLINYSHLFKVFQAHFCERTKLLFCEFSAWMRMSRLAINIPNWWCYYSRCCPLEDLGGTAGDNIKSKKKADWPFNRHLNASKMRFGSVKSQPEGEKETVAQLSPTLRLEHRKRCHRWRPGSVTVSEHDGKFITGSCCMRSHRSSAVA